MDRARFRLTKQLVIGALALDPTEREAYLQEACGDDEELRAEVRSLLAREQAAASVGESVLPVASLLDTSPTAVAPTRIGRYAIKGVLGEGGMGVVYRGLQTEPIRREVAVKVLRAGLDTARVLERFAWERRSLSRMDHPHIARILDAGSDDRDRPYVVLELVDGRPVTGWCRERGPDLGARLALMVKVCRAVQHAHDRGVLHRDLKPGNVLVREVDGEATPAVIDFGIAKALDDTDADLTLEGQRIGTPSYMSPEQLAGAEVDVRSDVYALGCILYELTAGVKPRRGDGDQEVAPPSRAGGETQDRVAASPRGRRRLRGDLDRICMMAIRPEPERRYPSAAALADDLERFVQGRPVTATPDSWSYRAGKAARRHPLRVALATAVLGFALAGVGFLAFHAERLERERRRALDAEAQARDEAAAAAQIAGFLEGLFTEADPVAGGAGEATARELLDQGAVRLESDLAEQPRVRGRLFGVMGRAMHGMGLHERAEDLLRRGLADLDQVPDSASVALERADLLSTLGTVLHDLGRFAEAEQADRLCLDILRRAHERPHTDQVWALADLATCVQAQGRLDEALPLLEEAIALGEEIGPEAARAVAWTRNMLGYVLSKRGRYHRAREIFADAYAAQRAVIAGDDIELINTLNNLGNIALALGDLAEAERYGVEALEMLRRIFANDHPAVARAMRNLGQVRREQGDLAAADTLLIGAHAMNGRTLGERHRNTILSLTAVSELRQQQGRTAEAETGFRRALELFHEQLGPDHDRTLRAQAALGSHYLEAGTPDRARDPLARAVAGFDRVLATDHPRLNEARVDLAETLLALDDPTTARLLLVEAVPHVETVYGTDDRRSVRARELLTATQ